MGFNDFLINNNGKKEHLNNSKHGVRKEQVDKKFHNLFDAYDANGDGTLETEELGGIFKGLTKFAGADKTLDATENKQVASLFVNQAGIENADFMGFVRSVSKATEDIVDSKTTPTADGGREVTTTYKDGSIETISYYPDGEYKFKKLDQKATTTTNFYTVGDNLNKKYTAAEIEGRVKKAYQQKVAQIKASAEKNKPVEGRAIAIIPDYNQFKQEYMQRNRINQGSHTHNFERHDFELSERGKQDVAVRDFVLSHYIDTHKAAQEALESMGILDDVGAAINAGAGELWNSIKNVWNGTEEEYQNFYELSKKFEPNYNKALRESGSLDVMRNNPEMFFRGFETDFKKDMGHKYNLENSVQFQQTAEQYQNAQILKQRIDILNKAMQEVRMYQSEQDALVYAPAQNEGLNPASHIVSANKLLLQYFNNDQEAVDMILNGTIGNADATIKAISGIKEDTEKLNKAVLDGKTFDQIQEDYKSQYKAMYGTDFVPDELTDKVMDAKATGGMVKLAAITIVSILVTRSPIMAEISGAAAGSAEATGAAANLVRTLVAKYGQTAVQQGIKLAMTSGTLATDVGLTLINQATSERGVNGEELWESTKGSAKYIFFGAYVGAPMAQAVSRSLGKIGATSRLFEGGTKTANGAIQTTSISGDKLIQNFVKGGNKVLTTGGAFLTDVAAFTGLEVATEGANLKDALSEQGQMLSKLKLMNHVLEYMLGAKAHTATSRANLDAAIEKSGVKNWNIKEIKTPQKTQYIVDIDGLPVGKFEDANQLATAMLERVTANFKTTQPFGLNDKPEEPTVTTTKKSPAKPSEGVKVEEPKPEVKEDKPVAQINTGASEMREAEMIKRYNELQAESERTGVVSEELLALTMELNDKGYHFKDGKLDFSYNENQTNMPNSDVSKAEFIKGLKEYGIDETTLGNLEYNVNRINMDLLNQLKEAPELLNSPFGVSILCDVKPEDVPAKIEAFNLLKDIELLSPDSKILMINKAGKDNLDAVKQNIEDFNYIKESGIEPSIVSSYGLAMVVDNMHFNREMFDLLKDNEEFVDKPYLSFNVNPDDIPAKTEVYNLLKDNSSCPVEQKVSILEKCNKDNLTKIKMVESYRADGIDERSVRSLYEKLDDIDENTLAAVKDNASLLDYYEASDIPTIKPEDMSAKAKIASELFLFSIDKNSEIAQELIKQTTKDNIETIHKKMAMIQAFSPFTTTRFGIIRNDIISEIQDGSIDVDVVSDLFKTIQHDKDLLEAISSNKDLKILKDVTEADVKAKKEIYDFVFSLTAKRMIKGKPVLLHVDKADLLSRTTQDNVAEIKEELSMDYRIAEAESLGEPQFTQKEMLLRKNKLRAINEGIDLQERLSLDDKNQLKSLFENAKTMEELDAKSNAYTAMVNREGGRLWSLGDIIEILDGIKIKEQADVVDAIGVGNSYGFQHIISENFAKNYKYLKQVDSSFRPLSIGTFSRYPHYLKFDDIKSQEEFEMFKELWNDPKINDCSIISHIVSDKNKYEAYKKLASNPDYLRSSNEDVSLVINAIVRGNVSEATDVSSIAKDLRIQNIQKELKEYRYDLTRERYDWEKTATEEDMQGLTVTFPNLNKAKFENYTGRTVKTIQEVIQRNTNLSFNEIESVLNNDVDFSNCDKRDDVLRKCSPEIAFRLAFCTDEDFNKVVDVLERRPEMLLEKFDSSNFDKMLKMSDTEWENFKVSIRDRGETEFNEAQYAADIQARLDGGFELDMSTYRTIERQRKLETNSGLGYAPKKTVKYDPSNNSERVMTPVEELPSAEQLLSQLETTGKIALSIEDKGGMNPTRNDRAEIKEKDRDRLGQAVSTDIVLNIGASRPWENSRLARDLIQNFYDGNGYTMEGVDIQVEKVGDKYNVKISGKGIYDYDRVLNFGYGSKVNDTRSAGQHGEGSKIVLGNLLYSRGADHVKYSAGKWELDFTADKTKKPSESEIMQTLTEVEKAQDGTSLEFETTDLDLVKELVKAKDYFYSPQNKDFANLDFENDYFGMKFLPEGEKGNMYVIQRYEVEGSEGLDGTMDGMTLIFKTKPEDQTLTELNNGMPFSLETGRNRVALSRQKITEMITRYAKTLSDEQLINIIGNMKEVYLFDNQNKNTHILEGFAKVAQERNLKIDFGHDDYIAVDRYPDDQDVHFAKMMGKTLVTHEMALVGVPDLYSYMQANKGHRTPVTELTETQAHKLQILEETIRMFSDNLDLSNCGIITRGEAEAPKYLYEPTEKDNTLAEAIISKGDDRTYQGHWVKADYLDSGDFFDLVATWLHETSHKVAGDGQKEFNDRLIKLEQLIVDMSNSDPAFGQKLRVLAQKYNEVSQKAPEDNSAYPKMTVRETDQMISDILRLVVTEAEEKAKVQQTQTTKNETKINDETSDISETTATEPEVNDNILTRFFKKIFGRKKTKPVNQPKPQIRYVPDIVKEIEQKYVYTSPKKGVRTSGENQFTTYKDHIETLKATGSLDIAIPVTSELHPIKGSTEIKPEDRAVLDRTVNTPLMLDYNSAQEWTYDMVARDILQNFYDGHGGTLDGVKIDIQKVDGKYKVKISGESEYNYFYLKNIAASSKTGDENQAGGYGEGAKMASKSLLGAYVTDKITFASGDWAMDFAREEGVERQDMHMTRTLHENPQRVNGTYVEFETANADLVESIIKAKDFYQHADNPDFKGLDFENDKFGFRILNENEKGNLYYNQRYAVKSDGELEGALNGISIVFKKELTTEDKERFKIANDCDRRGLTSEEIKSIATCMAKSMSDEELMSSIQQLERFWSIKDPRVLKQNNRVMTPEEGFAIGLIEEARNRYLEFNVDGQKVVAVDPYSWNINVDHVNYLKSQGYVIADKSLANLGFKTVSDVMKELNKVVPVEGTIVEKQKLALITEALPQKLPLKVFEASPDDNQVCITSENGEQFIAIDRRYLEKTDFNTLYTQILSRVNYASDGAEWGYKMTEMLAQQLRLANDPNYMAKYNAIANRYSQIK